MIKPCDCKKQNLVKMHIKLQDMRENIKCQWPGPGDLDGFIDFKVVEV